MYIYKLTNKVNGKMYIGQTVRSMAERLAGHKRNYERNVHTKLYDAMRKYGWDKFDAEVIEVCSSLEALNARETYWIKYYNTVENGYNMYYGGDNNCMFVKEIAEKHDERMRTKEVREKISKTMKEYHATHKVSEETKKKISNKLRAFYDAGKKPKYKKPQHLTPEHKQALINSKYKKVRAILVDGTDVIFNSVQEAYGFMVQEKGYPYRYGSFADNVKKSNDTGKSYKGITWKYI